MKKSVDSKQFVQKLFTHLSLLSLALWAIQMVILAVLLPRTGEVAAMLQFAKTAITFWSIACEVIFFLIAQLALYVLLTGFVYWVTNRVSLLCELKPRMQYLLGILLWSTLVVIIYGANTCYFPHSLFSLLPLTADRTVCKAITFVLAAGWLIALMMAVVGHLIYLGSNAPSIKSRLVTLLVCIMIFSHLGYDYWSVHRDSRYVGKNTAPNVIVIGFDAFRPDYIKQRTKQNLTPHLDQFFARALEFTNTWTTEAHSLPAWVSWLTGETPNQSGAFVRLTNVEEMHPEASIATILKARGYHTIHAMDKRRYNNIDEHFGFDEVVGPQVGFNDFLLGTLNDSPLSNFVVNTHLGQWLFPYSFANRAAAVTYYPETFVRWLQKVLAGPREKPVFLSFQMSLSHSPYFWAGGLPAADAPNELVGYYQSAIAEQDYQFGEILDILKKYHYLDNSIVIVLSDHGDALHQVGDRFTQPRYYQAGSPRPHDLYKIAIDDKATGHGSDILTMDALKSLLGVRFFGLATDNTLGENHYPASLVDVKPTILALLGMPTESKQTPMGVSLAPMIRGETQSLLERASYVENGVDFTEFPLSFYNIDPVTGHLVFKAERRPESMINKQKGIRYGGWYLVALPANAQIKHPRALLLNLKTQEWTDNLASEFAHRAPLKAMMESLKQHFGSDVRLDFPELD